MHVYVYVYIHVSACAKRETFTGLGSGSGVNKRFLYVQMYASFHRGTWKQARRSGNRVQGLLL